MQLLDNWYPLRRFWREACNPWSHLRPPSWEGITGRRSRPLKVPEYSYEQENCDGSGKCRGEGLWHRCTGECSGTPLCKIPRDDEQSNTQSAHVAGFLLKAGPPRCRLLALSHGHHHLWNQSVSLPSLGSIVEVEDFSLECSQGHVLLPEVPSFPLCVPQRFGSVLSLSTLTACTQGQLPRLNCLWSHHWGRRKTYFFLISLLEFAVLLQQ